MGVGISIDYRRKNRSEQSLRDNVARLQQYKANLILFPKKSNRSKPKATDSSKDEQGKAEQVCIIILSYAFGHETYSRIFIPVRRTECIFCMHDNIMFSWQ